ncbi:MAG: B3/B4 domain-containing protein [Candidatus Thorarchaeota archaeon]
MFLLTMGFSKSIKFETGPPGSSIVVVELDELKLGKSSKEFEEHEKSLFNEMRENTNLEYLSKDPLIQSYRALHWSYGMDPTKKRGSSEAVLRRVLQGENLWRISDLVDIVNLASAYHKIPIGLIDASKIEGQLTLRIAKKGEIFNRIGGETIECRGREVVLADDIGIICYGYAIHDSERTKVTQNSHRVLLLHYGSDSASKNKIEAAVKVTTDMIERWILCNVSEPLRYVSAASV